MSKLHSSLGKIGFVLHGGFMRGAFQVGALKAFDEFRLYPSYIVGESVGAINGAAFAAGKVELLWKIYLEIAKNPHRYLYRYNFYMLLRAFFWSQSILVNTPLKKIVIEKSLNIQDLISSHIKIDIVTTDFQNACEVIFSNKNPEHQTAHILTEALLASAAVPAIFPPFLYEGRQLFDGNIIQKSLLTFAAKEGCDTLFVVLNDPLELATSRLFRTIYAIARRGQQLTSWRNNQKNLMRSAEINNNLQKYAALTSALEKIVQDFKIDEEAKKELKQKIIDVLSHAGLSFQDKRQLKFYIIDPGLYSDSDDNSFFGQKSIPRLIDEGYNKTMALLNKLENSPAL